MSVAAMEYAQTHRWSRSRHFSGTGLGLGTGLGAGLAIGGGTYSERGEIRSKRAEVFSEPARYALSAGLFLVVGGVLALMFFEVPALLDLVTEAPPSDPPALVGHATASMASDLSPTLWFVAPLLAVVIFAIGFRRYQQTEAEEAQLNAEAWPRQIERYNQLRYCENCHLLFDPDGRCEFGSELGFQRMMDLATLEASKD